MYIIIPKRDKRGEEKNSTKEEKSLKNGNLKPKHLSNNSKCK